MQVTVMMMNNYCLILNSFFLYKKKTTSKDILLNTFHLIFKFILKKNRFFYHSFHLFISWFLIDFNKL
jgi:hypothetical protein